MHFCDIQNLLEPLLDRKVRSNICVEEQIISGEKYTRTFSDLIGAHGVYHLSNIFRNAHRIKKKNWGISLGTHLDKSSTSENIL